MLSYVLEALQINLPATNQNNHDYLLKYKVELSHLKLFKA